MKEFMSPLSCQQSWFVAGIQKLPHSNTGTIINNYPDRGSAIFYTRAQQGSIIIYLLYKSNMIDINTHNTWTDLTLSQKTSDDDTIKLLFFVSTCNYTIDGACYHGHAGPGSGDILCESAPITPSAPPLPW